MKGLLEASDQLLRVRVVSILGNEKLTSGDAKKHEKGDANPSGRDIVERQVVYRVLLLADGRIGCR